MPESEVKRALKELFREMYGEDPLSDILCSGVEKMSEEKAEKILGDLQEYRHVMPIILAEFDGLIRYLIAREENQ